MKRSMFCLLTRCVAILATAVMVGSVNAQNPPSSPFNYQVEYAHFPPEQDGTGRLRDVGKVNGELIIVGYARTVSDQNRGFVYFHETNSFVDMPTFLQLDETVWIESYCTGLNTNGLVVGAVKDVNGKLHGCWFDLLATNPTLKLLEDDFPEIIDGNNTNARAFNSNGEILVDNGWVVNINDGSSVQLPAEFTSYIDINELGTVLGRGANGIIRYNIHNNMLDSIDGVSGNAEDINNLDEFCGYVSLVIDEVCRGNSNNCSTTRQQHAYRWGDGPDYDWLSDPALTAGGKFVRGESLNDSGDIVGEYEGDPWGFDDSIFHYSQRDASGDEVGTTYTVRNLVDDPFLEGATLWQMKVTERDTSLSTPAPIIVGKASSGSDPYFDYETRIMILIPRPSISVTPTAGLVTTESPGPSASFDVVLTGEPAADVTIGISSSDTTEGTVDQASLTFTPANWDTPQTVTITGVDDGDLDGDVAYTIMTAAATSTDPDYDGLDADDVSVINEDDDSPSGGGSESYDSADTPLAIPDVNDDPNFITSDIFVGDHLITNLTVNIDITHQRPSDLEVYLVGPDGGAPVQLFNFSGDNAVADFNGESSLGLWTLEVYDTRRKKTGTLNSWSITVDY